MNPTKTTSIPYVLGLISKYANISIKDDIIGNIHTADAEPIILSTQLYPSSSFPSAFKEYFSSPLNDPKYTMNTTNIGKLTNGNTGNTERITMTTNMTCPGRSKAISPSEFPTSSEFVKGCFSCSIS